MESNPCFLSPPLTPRAAASLAGYACDWFSFGVLMYELQEKAWPFGDSPAYADIRTEFVLPALIDDDGKTEIPHLFDLLSGLLDWVPSTRLGGGAEGAKELMAHPYWGEADWELIENRRMRSPLLGIARQRLDAWENKEKVDLANARKHNTEQRRISFVEGMDVAAKLIDARKEQNRVDELNKSFSKGKSDRQSVSKEEEDLVELEIEMSVDNWEFNSHNAIAAEYVESHADVVSTL